MASLFCLAYVRYHPLTFYFDPHCVKDQGLADVESRKAVSQWFLIADATESDGITKS